MAKINVVGNALIITSEVRAEDILLAQKFRPEALTLEDENKDPVFMIGVTKGTGSINGFGVSFDGVARDGSGKATLTLAFDGPSDPDDVKAAIADKYGIAIARLNQIETALPEVLADIAEQKAAVVAAIEVE